MNDRLSEADILRAELRGLIKKMVAIEAELARTVPLVRFVAALAYRSAEPIVVTEEEMDNAAVMTAFRFKFETLVCPTAPRVGKVDWRLCSYQTTAAEKAEIICARDEARKLAGQKIVVPGQP